MKTLWYRFIKFYIKVGLFFYTKKIVCVGKENIPKKGAVLLVVNHPNGLLDPLMVTTNVSRDTHYLVRAAAFKNLIANTLLRSLNLMPIYRIRDGRNEISKNESVFNDCFKILKNKKILMIFPEGSHDQRRTVRTISKGFTRIVFGALEKHPNIKLSIIPVGLSYQNIGKYPSKVAVHYGTPIDAKSHFNPLDLTTSVNTLKEEVSNQLKTLSVHIPDDENYKIILKKLHENNTDFTDVHNTNQAIIDNKFTMRKKAVNYIKPMYYLFLINSLIPWLIWKKIAVKIDEREFIDTFRVVVGIILFPIFYIIQSMLLVYFYSTNFALFYLGFTILTTLVFVKLSTTPTE